MAKPAVASAGGKRCTARLARVADRSPALVALPSIGAPASASLHAVVKLRPTLVHYLVDGRVQCVIRSRVPITAVASASPQDDTPDDKPQQLILATADGNVWAVSLPAHAQPATGKVTDELILETGSASKSALSVFSTGLAITPTQWPDSTDSSATGSVHMETQLSGVQSVALLEAPATLLLMRSVVTPSVLRCRGSERPSLELHELEGDQSTCSLCLHGRSAMQRGLLAQLFPLETQLSTALAVLQGDVDGSVRFALVRDANALDSTGKSGTALTLGQRVQALVPFTSASGSASPSLDALLVLGAHGRIALVDCQASALSGTAALMWTKLEVGRAVQSLVFVRSLEAFVYCSNGATYVCRSADLRRAAQNPDAADHATLSDSSSSLAAKLPFPPGALRLAVHEDTQALSILFASGRVTTWDAVALQQALDGVLPSLEQQSNQTPQPSHAATRATSESRVRHLLGRIAQISTEAATLRAQSRHMDVQLKSLHSALEMQRLVNTDGLESVVTCELNASLATTGGFFERQTVKLTCRLTFVKPEAVVSFDNWSLCLYVRTRRQVVTTYSFPVKNPSTGAISSEKSVILDSEALALQDQGTVQVSCSLVFCPDSKRRTKGDDDVKSPQDDLLSLAIPLVQAQTFLLAQLSRPVVEDTPTSQLAIRAAFRQEQERQLPAQCMATDKGEDEMTPSTLWSGCQWWTALAVHAQRNPWFAGLWGKVAPVDAPALELSPPSRFVMLIPEFFPIEVEDDEDDEDDADAAKRRVERIAAFLQTLLGVPQSQVAHLRRCCRRQHGKVRIALRTFSGNLIVLRFAPAEDQQGSLELNIQCSDVADLSAMRALVLETISGNKSNKGDVPGVEEDDERLGEMALDAGALLEPISSVESVLEDLVVKMSRSLEDPQTAICTDEVLHALSQLAQVETHTLALYWKTRAIFNRTIL